MPMSADGARQVIALEYTECTTNGFERTMSAANTIAVPDPYRRATRRTATASEIENSSAVNAFVVWMSGPASSPRIQYRGYIRNPVSLPQIGWPVAICNGLMHVSNASSWKYQASNMSRL